MEQVFLSRRNLETLLSKLDRNARGEHSLCTIVKFDRVHKEYPSTVVVAITAVEDSAYYTDREPGAVYPEDEPAGTCQDPVEACRMFCAWKGGGPCLAEGCPRQVLVVDDAPYNLRFKGAK